MTPARKAQIASLIRHIPALRANEPELLSEAARELRMALEAENHPEIARLDRELDYLLSGAALRLADDALARAKRTRRKADVDLAQMLTRWGRRVPRAERERFVDLLLENWAQK